MAGEWQTIQMKQQKKTNSNQIRIIGGEFKRRQLAFAAIENLRPTPDRVRETLFNWLMWDIQGAKVLDLCAGSGALGFEALSRGAKHVVMVEPNPEQVKYLRQNCQLLKCDNAEILAITAQQAIQHYTNKKETFNLIFLDPPYSLDLWQEISALLEPILAENALIYVEADKAVTQLDLPSSWQLQKETKAGLVHAGLFLTKTAE